MAAVPSHVLGFALLFCTVGLWVASSVALQMVFGSSEPFRKPLFVSVFNSCSYIACLLPDACRKKLTMRALIVALPLSATAGFLWLVAAFVFNMSLEYTSVATNTVISSTSSIFTFCFSWALCREPFRLANLAAAMLCLCGCSIVAAHSPQNVSKGAISNSGFGDFLALASAAVFALSSVLLRKWAPPDLQMDAYMGVTGLLSWLAAPAVLGVAHLFGLEIFGMPHRDVLAMLVLNALLGCTLANYCYNSAVLLLSPLVANVCLSLGIPLSAMVDEALLGEHRFSSWWKLGAAAVAAAVVVAAVDFEPAGEPPARREKIFDEEELHFLLGEQEKDR